MGKRINGEGSIYFMKSRNKWASAVIVEGKKVIKYSSTPEEATDKLLDLRNKYNLISYSGDLRLSDWINEWLFTVKAGSVSTKTLQCYQSLLETYVKKYPISKIKISEIVKMDVVRLFNQLLKDGASKQIIGKVKTRLYSCMEDASDLIIKNPVNGVKIPSNAQDNKRRYSFEPEIKSEGEYNAFSTHEQNSLIKEILSRDGSFVAKTLDFLILFSLGTGLRLGEVLALEYDRDFANEFAEVRIKHNLQKMPIYKDRKVVGYELLLRPPKSQASIRTVQIPDPLIPYIKRQIIDIKKNSLRDPYFENHGLLFPAELGGYFERKRPPYHLNAIEKRIGISKVNLHGLRHTYATRLLEQAVSIQVISSLLGHSDVQITQKIYTHVMEDLKKESVSKLNNILAI